MLIFYKHPLRGKEKMMVNVFYKNRNTIGQFMVALIFLGTFGFLFTFDGFVPKLQASGCCGGGEAAVTSFAADSSGDYGSAIPMDVEVSSTNHLSSSIGEDKGNPDCECIDSGCNSCETNDCGGEPSYVNCETGCNHTCPDDFHGCCSDKDDEYCSSNEFADSECCEAGDCGS